MGPNYDVVICGGGLGALLLARQLRLHQPERSVLVIDKHPDAASGGPRFKPGESIPEGGAYHARHDAALEDYLFTSHVPKFGFRFFFGGGERPLDARLEYGGTQWPPFATFQLDRGVLETDLRRMLRDDGVEIVQGLVSDIELRDAGPHRVRVECEGERRSVLGRWVVDATGRRRLLASKLGLTVPTHHHVGASWIHLDGRVDIGQLVDSGNQVWHGRTGPPRWYSTVHLSGRGYWMWIIPLVSGATSIGVIADERLHPIRERASAEGTLAWCRRHEPHVAPLVEALPVLGASALKNFTYGTRRVFSAQRWACIGDAAMLSDPLYALGQDLIGHATSITTRLVGLDFAGGLSEAVVDDYDRMLRTMFDLIIEQYRDMYPTFGSAFIHTEKLAWDSSMYFGVLQQILMQNVYDHPEAPQMLLEIFERLAPLNRAMQRLLLDAYQQDGPMEVFEGMRTWAPLVTRFADSSLDKCGPHNLSEFFDGRMAALEEIATAIFGEVLRHSPSVPRAEAQRVLGSSVGIQPRAASLDPERWVADGLFDSSRVPVDFERPAQFDVRNRIEGELRDFRPVHRTFAESARRHADEVALVDGPESLTYGELLAAVERLGGVLAEQSGERIALRLSSLRPTLLAMLAVLSAGKSFALLEADWSEEQRRLAVERGSIDAVLTDEDLAEALRGTTTTQAVELAPEELRARPAYCDIRFTPFGPRVATLDHAALFRMCRWLPNLMRKGLPGDHELRSLRCLWAGPASPELMVPLLAGCTLVLVDPPVTDGRRLLQRIETGPIELVLARPSVWKRLLDAGWPSAGLRAVSVRDALPKELGLRLRTRAQRVCDFGYATFAH